MAFDPVHRIEGVAVPLLADNIDTDVIIRIERLTDLARDHLGPFAFEALRLDNDGRPKAGHVLNDPLLVGASILLAGRNFGCGSSREGAVWALQAAGFRAVIAESFGSIFAANCFQNGLLPVALPKDDLIRLTAAVTAAPETRVEIDLDTLTVRPAGGGAIPFAIAPLRRDCLREGITDLELTARYEREIGEAKARDRTARPWLYPADVAGSTSH